MYSANSKRTLTPSDLDGGKFLFEFEDRGKSAKMGFPHGPPQRRPYELSPGALGPTSAPIPSRFKHIQTDICCQEAAYAIVLSLLYVNWLCVFSFF